MSRIFYFKKNFLKIKVGLTLMETVLALVIGLAIIGGALIYFNKGNSNAKVIEYQEELMGIVSVVNTLYSSTSGYSTISAQIIARSHLLPEKYSTDGINILSPEKMQVDVWGISLGKSISVNNYMIVFNNVSHDICTQIFSINVSGNIIDRSINNKSLGSGSPEISDMSICRDTNTLSWVFY